MKTLETERLIFKKGVVEDAEKYHFNFWCQEETAKFMLWNTTKSVEEAKQKTIRWSEYQQNNPQWFIYEKSSNQPIGFISIIEQKNNKWGDVGLCIGLEFIKKGYGKEVMTKIIDLFKQNGGVEIEYSHLEGNYPSQKLAEKLGFVYSHTSKRFRARDQKEFDELFYILKIK